jgi:hypothetical protein
MVTEWKTWPGFSKYEASLEKGLIRNRAGLIMSLFPDKDGYLRVTLTDDDGKKHGAMSVARCILTAHDRPPLPGEEACHGPGGKQDNRLANLRWDDRAGNEREKVEAGNGPQPHPTYPCKDGCGNLVINEGRRCLDCLGKVKVEAAAMLDRGVNLYDVAEHFGYTGPDWVWKLAVEGGCTLTKRDALTQQPSASQRVTAKLVTLRGRFRRPAGGDAA